MSKAGSWKKHGGSLMQGPGIHRQEKSGQARLLGSLEAWGPERAVEEHQGQTGFRIIDSDLAAGH